MPEPKKEVFSIRLSTKSIRLLQIRGFLNKLRRSTWKKGELSLSHYVNDLIAKDCLKLIDGKSIEEVRLIEELQSAQSERDKLECKIAKIAGELSSIKNGKN